MPTVKLVAATPYPVETIFATEMFAKTNSKYPFLIDPETIAAVRDDESIEGQGFEESCDELKISRTVAAYVAEVDRRVLNLVTMAVPVCEVVQLSFQIDRASIAWREQLVRHRVGTSYWIQSGRITDYSNICDDFSGAGYNVPDAVANDPELLKDWQRHWEDTESFFRLLKEKGILDQDAREIIGSGALHRLTFTANLRALKDIIGHRTCFIAQQHWHPVIHGICDALVKLDPLFEALAKPPCLDHKNKFTGCKYEGMAKDRYEGKDPLPVCPIWHGHLRAQYAVTDDVQAFGHVNTRKELRTIGKWDDAMVKAYSDHWHWSPDAFEKDQETL